MNPSLANVTGSPLSFEKKFDKIWILDYNICEHFLPLFCKISIMQQSRHTTVAALLHLGLFPGTVQTVPVFLHPDLKPTGVQTVCYLYITFSHKTIRPYFRAVLR
jgi:hypothetical protein